MPTKFSKKKDSFSTNGAIITEYPDSKKKKSEPQSQSLPPLNIKKTTQSRGQT